MISQAARPDTAPLAPTKTEPLPTSKARTLRTHLLVLAGYALLTVIMTNPIPFRLSSEVPGGGDAWQNVWNLWWVKQALLVQHTNPYHTDLLYYPNGVSLYFHTLVLTAGLIGIPLQLLGFNLLATYNLMLLLTFVLGGYSMYLLCYYLTRHRWASFVGGLIFSFSPYHFAHLFGHMNLSSLQWLPFYVLALLKAFEPGPVWPLKRHLLPTSAHSSTGDYITGELRGGLGVNGAAKTPTNAPRHALLWSLAAGALLAVTAYTDWLYAIFLLLFTGMYAGWRLLVPSQRRQLGLGVASWFGAGVRLTLIALTFLLLTVPIFFPTLSEAGKGYAQQPPSETLVYSSDLTSAVTPSELHPIWGEAVKERVNATGPYLPLRNPTERDVFLGYMTLLLASVGVWRLRRVRAVHFWTFAAVATWVLSLGPILQYDGKTRFTLYDVTVPLPYLLLSKLPLINIMRTPARLTVLTMLALGVLAAYAVANLLGSRNFSLSSSLKGLLTPRNAVWGMLAPAVILFESLSTPFPTVPPGWNVPIYSKIAAEPGRFALLELPLRPFGDYMAYQTIHGKPIVGGYLARQPPYPALQEVPTLHYLLETTPAEGPLKAQVGSGQGTATLRQLNIKYVIIRWWAFTPEQKASMQTKLATLLPRPPDYSYPADQVEVWQLK